jgi:hypothetical protein
LDDLPIYQKAMELSVYLETIYHLVVWEMERSWNRNSSASRADKGTHAGVRRLQQFMLQATTKS